MGITRIYNFQKIKMNRKKVKQVGKRQREGWLFEMDLCGMWSHQRLECMWYRAGHIDKAGHNPKKCAINVFFHDDATAMKTTKWNFTFDSSSIYCAQCNFEHEKT